MRLYCFIANYHFTPVFIGIARQLQQYGINSVWITVNRKDRDLLHAQGWSETQVLYLPLSEQSEVPFQDFPLKIFDMVMADRALRHMPHTATAYLQNAARRITDFLSQHRPQAVFGEATWAHERLVVQACRHLVGIRFLRPHTVRFPPGRWGFFDGEDQAHLVEQRARGAAHIDAPFEIRPPDYVKHNDLLLARAQSTGARLSRLKRFLTRENIDPTDPTNIQSRWRTLRIAGGEELNRVMYRFVQRTPVTPEILARPFVLYALHKQPESSIDVLGRYYEDQAALVHALWRTLPSGWWLYVKEHSNAIGDRSPWFYKQLQALPHVALIDEKASAKELIKHAQAVGTVSGTIAFEAALMGKRSFTLVPMFFNRFSHCCRISLEELRAADNLQKLLESKSKPYSAESDEAFKQHILLNSYEGRFTDAVTDPNVMAAANIAQLAAGFEQAGR